VWF
ncbi:transketolase, thiamine diphosphate binding domain protein, partial [Vibrio parahaemolyticus EKP-026]|jgi:three-Cys-motif partner protein